MEEIDLLNCLVVLWYVLVLAVGVSFAAVCIEDYFGGKDASKRD